MTGSIQSSEQNNLIKQQIGKFLVPLIVSILMTLLISLIISILTLDQWQFSIWSKTWLLSWLVAFPSLLIILPCAQKLAAHLLNDLVR